MRDFVDGGVTMLQERVAQRLTSEDTARMLGKRRRAIFRDVLAQPESEVARFVRKTPWEALEAMVPALVAHNLARAEVRAALRAELEAVVGELSTQTLGELLDELGLREQAARSGARAGSAAGTRVRRLTGIRVADERLTVDDRPTDFRRTGAKLPHRFGPMYRVFTVAYRRQG